MKFRSKFEAKVFSFLAQDKKVSVGYESEVIEYVPVKPKRYTPDFILTGNSKIYIEVKGRFLSADRSKHLAIKQQYPELDIRFFFMNPKVKLSKVSKTTYGDWCDKHGILWSSNFEDLAKWQQEARKGGTSICSILH